VTDFNMLIYEIIYVFFNNIYLKLNATWM